MARKQGICTAEIWSIASGKRGLSGVHSAPTSEKIQANRSCQPNAEQLLAQYKPTKQPIDNIVKKQANTKKRARRRSRRGKRELTENLTIIGTNAYGLNSKRDSFTNILQSEKPHVFMVQETKMKRLNQWTIDGYELYEKVRKIKGGGGIMIGMDKNFDITPVVVSDHDEDVEILVIEVAFKCITVRFLTAYGPQEDAPEDVINKFYLTLEEEIVRCEQENCALIAELDCNAKLGSGIIEGDPHTMSSNGKVLWDILERRGCSVINGSDK